MSKVKKKETNPQDFTESITNERKGVLFSIYNMLHTEYGRL